ncbi:hypothetical protein [Meiothermus sp.]|uniref:hypothetical protein n=1 Tax=Meiothermus sp. TaxID=1955249 RepID=UPI00307FA507
MKNPRRHDAVLLALDTIRARFREAPLTRTWTHQQVLLGETLIAVAEEKLSSGQEISDVLAKIRQLASNLLPPASATVSASLEAIVNWLELDRGDGYAD